MALDKDIQELSHEFECCQSILIALGDEMRQHLIMAMMNGGKCNGMRVTEITERSNLSRQAVSHHLQILKRAGIVKMRREGTKNYYYFDADMKSFDELIHMLEHAKKIMGKMPDRSGEDW